MRFGLELISAVRRPDMIHRVSRSLESLGRTVVEGLDGRPAMLLTHRPTPLFDYGPFVQKLNQFEVMTRTDPPALEPMALCMNASYKVLDIWPDVTHLCFLWDDFIYNPQWLIELEKLVKRRPDGIAWHVYRSRYERHHWIVGREDSDVLMSMHDGIGCVTREEWMAYKEHHNGRDFTCSGGSTPDIHHMEKRPGKRWATGVDYMENLGRHGGIEAVDCAIAFVGE